MAQAVAYPTRQRSAAPRKYQRISESIGASLTNLTTHDQAMILFELTRHNKNVLQYTKRDLLCASGLQVDVSSEIRPVVDSAQVRVIACG